MSAESDPEEALAGDRMEILARQMVAGLAHSQIMEADGVNAMAYAVLLIAQRSTDDRIRPGAVRLLREVADRLEAQDQLTAFRAGGGLPQ